MSNEQLLRENVAFKSKCLYLLNRLSKHSDVDELARAVPTLQYIHKHTSHAQVKAEVSDMVMELLHRCDWDIKIIPKSPFFLQLALQQITETKTSDFAVLERVCAFLASNAEQHPQIVPHGLPETITRVCDAVCVALSCRSSPPSLLVDSLAAITAVLRSKGRQKTWQQAESPESVLQIQQMLLESFSAALQKHPFALDTQAALRDLVRVAFADYAFDKELIKPFLNSTLTERFAMLPRFVLLCGCQDFAEQLSTNPGPVALVSILNFCVHTHTEQSDLALEPLEQDEVDQIALNCLRLNAQLMRLVDAASSFSVSFGITQNHQLSTTLVGVLLLYARIADQETLSVDELANSNLFFEAAAWYFAESARSASSADFLVSKCVYQVVSQTSPFERSRPSTVAHITLCHNLIESSSKARTQLLQIDTGYVRDMADALRKYPATKDLVGVIVDSLILLLQCQERQENVTVFRQGQLCVCVCVCVLSV
jgi:hypothetical protein